MIQMYEYEWIGSEPQNCCKSVKRPVQSKKKEWQLLSKIVI